MKETPRICRPSDSDLFKLSIESGNIDAIKVLLDAGANPNLGDDDGMSVRDSSI